MTVEEIKAKLKEKEYDFLREDEHLKGRIGMLNLGGSIAYGTNLEGKGDIDLRGFYFEKKEEIIGIVPNSEQVVETETDTVLYSFNKFINLLISCNPNTIEFLGCKPEHYFKMSEIAQMLLDNRKAFLSKNCVRSFGGYANQQLNMLENAIARDRLTKNKMEEDIKL